MEVGALQIDRVTQALISPLAEAGFELVEVKLASGRGRRILRVAVHRPGGVDLAAVARASRLCSDVLDADADLMNGRYTLEVTSLGLDRPLESRDDFRRRLGETVRVDTVDGDAVVGVLSGCDDEGVVVAGDGAEVRVPFARIARGRVEIGFDAAARSGAKRNRADRPGQLKRNT